MVCYARFQQFFSHIMATAHIIHVFPGFHQHWVRALNYFAQGRSHKKIPEDPVWLEPRPPGLRVKQFTVEPNRTALSKLKAFANDTDCKTLKMIFVIYKVENMIREKKYWLHYLHCLTAFKRRETQEIYYCLSIFLHRYVKMAQELKERVLNASKTFVRHAAAAILK